MKKLLVIKTIIIALCLGAMISPATAQNDADPAITSFSFAASPIVVGNNTTLTVFFTNNGFTTAIAAGSVGLNVSIPTSGEYKAFPEAASALSGTFAGKFNWSYNAVTKTFIGVSNQAIAPGDGGTIIATVRGYIPVASRISVANIIRYNPGAYPNENTNNNNLTASLGVVPGSPQPVKLLYFTATKQAKVVNLNWTTTSEINSRHFDIQYSKDGSSWQSIGIVAAAGNSSIEKSYSFVHTTPVAGVNYYRLKQVDLDAKFENSLIRTATFRTSSDIYVFPNPTTDKVVINSDLGGKVQSVTVFANDGRQMIQVNNFSFGNSIDMRNYGPGVYMLKIVDKNGNVELLKVVKH